MSELLIIVGLSVVAAVVCFFTAMVGTGSGLVLVPLMIMAGLTPVQAIAVHKFEALWTVVSGYRYYVNKQVLMLDFPWYLLLGSFGTFFGAAYIHFIPSVILQVIVAVAIVAVGVYMLFFHKKPEERTMSSWKRLVLIVSMFFFGLYEGTFGSGNGFFIAALFFALIGSDELKTVGMITVLAAFWNIIAAFTHFTFGSLIFKYALPIGFSSMMGAWFGAGYTLKGGKDIVRKAIIAISFIGGIALLLKALLDMSL